MVAHVSNASHKGGEGSDDGNETCNDQGFGAVFFIVSVGFIEVVLFQPSIVTAEDLRP